MRGLIRFGDVEEVKGGDPYKHLKIMKFKLLVAASIASASFATFTLSAAAQSLGNGWVKVGENKRGTVSFIRKHNWIGQYRIAEVKYSNSDGSLMTEYDCMRGRYRFLTSDGIRDSWNDILPGTLGEADFRHVCS